MRKKIFVISHAMTEVSNRERWFELSKLNPELDIKILIPRNWICSWFGKDRVITTNGHQQGNVEIIPVDVTDQRRWTRYIIPSLPRLILDEKPDLIFAFQEEGTVALCWTLLCAKLFSFKTKVGFFSWQNIEIHQSKWHQRLRWKITKELSDFFLAGSTEIYNLFKKTQYKKTIYVQTELDVSPKVFYEDMALKNDFREKYQLHQPLVIGFAGRLVEEKGVQDLSQALKLIDGKVPYQMVWAGDGVLMDELKKENPHHIFLGHMKVEQMKTFYNGIDCLILPSRTTNFWKEQFGLVIPQALLTNRAVIGSSSGAIPEVVTNQDYIFEERNSKELAEKITLFYEKKLSPPYDGSRFSTPAIARQTLQIINEMS